MLSGRLVQPTTQPCRCLCSVLRSWSGSARGEAKVAKYEQLEAMQADANLLSLEAIGKGSCKNKAALRMLGIAEDVFVNDFGKDGVWLMVVRAQHRQCAVPPKDLLQRNKQSTTLQFRGRSHRVKRPLHAT